jgi:hypothetical protein
MTDWSAMSNGNANNAINPNSAINDWRTGQFSRRVLGIDGADPYSRTPTPRKPRASESSHDDL